MEKPIICEVCNRVEGGEMQLHHLLPKSFSNRTKAVHSKENKILIHKMCHQKIHATFSELELFTLYSTTELIKNHEEMAKFIKWINKKPAGYYNKNTQSAERKRQR